MRFSEYVLILIFASTVNCNNNIGQDVPVYRLSMGVEPNVLQLSDLMEVERIVPLETKDDILLPSQITIVSARNHIVISDEKRLSLYSNEGSFLRFLASSGDGPNEFVYITAYGLHPEEDVLYYSDSSDKDNIHGIDLSTGRQESIPLPIHEISSNSTGSNLNSLIFIDKETIACVPRNMAGMLYSIFYITPEGHFLDGVPHHPDSSQQTFAIKYVNGNIHLMKGINLSKSKSDTIFSVNKLNRIPQSIIRVESSTESSGDILLGEISCEGSNTLLVSVQGVMGFWSSHAEWVWKKFFVNKLTGESYPVSGFSIDDLGGIVGEFPSIVHDENGRIALKVEADEFRSQANEILTEKTLAPEIQARLKKLLTQVTDNSNPIVIIGRLK